MFVSEEDEGKPWEILHQMEANDQLPGINRAFWLFGGQDYYASGGFSDFIGGFDTANEAMTYAKLRQSSKTYNDRIEWWQVFDTKLRRVCHFYGSAYSGRAEWVHAEEFK